ncbi:MAG: cation transporter, partial [Halobacteriota archaeon]
MPSDGTGGECSLCGRVLHPSTVETDAGDRFCSTGCRDVYETLGSAADSSGDRSNRERPDDDVSDRTASSDREGGDEFVHTFFRIDGMYSATCEAFLESVANGCDGVRDAEASYVTELIRVEHDPDRVGPIALRDALSTLGYTAYRTDHAAGAEQGPAPTALQSGGPSGLRKRRDDQFLALRYAAGVLFGAFLMVPYVTILYPAYLYSIVGWDVLRLYEYAVQIGEQGGVGFLRLYFVLTGVVLVFTGLPVLRGAYIGLKMRRPNTDLLVAMTAVSAYIYSTIAVLIGRYDVFFDLTLLVAAAVTAAVFYESSSKQRALNRLTELTVSNVDTARQYAADGTPIDVPVAELTAGDRVFVRQGERIPVDGVLVESRCTVDEAVVTGESMPIEKRAGETVLGGSIVTDGAAVVEAGTDATSSIDRITAAVRTVQSADHGVQRHADRVA